MAVVIPVVIVHVLELVIVAVIPVVILLALVTAAMAAMADAPQHATDAVPVVDAMALAVSVAIRRVMPAYILPRK